VRRLLIASFLVLVPFAAFAQDALSRRDGFLLLWDSIDRLAEETKETFEDVDASSLGAREIGYALVRGILDDTSGLFRPEEPLLKEDALLWLFRTRNIDDLDQLTLENMPALLGRYPITQNDASMRQPLGNREALITLMRALDTMLSTEVHEVSLYAEDFHGKGTAFGESFDMHALTAAHRTFPHNTLVKVTNEANGKSVVVRINDRGPYVEGRDMDLSLAAFTTIEERSRGILRATFERIGDASIVDSCSLEKVLYQQRIMRDVRLRRGVPRTAELGKPLVLMANRAFVVRGIVYPNGVSKRVQDWVLPGEQFTFTPAEVGRYVFTFGATEGGRREMVMEVTGCGTVGK